MSQDKCKVKGCPGSAIPGRSPHGLCLRHEMDIEKGILKHTCAVKGCGVLFKPFADNVPMCQDCRKLVDKIWWLLKYTEPQEVSEKPKIYLPGGQVAGPKTSLADVMKKVAKVQGKA